MRFRFETRYDFFLEPAPNESNFSRYVEFENHETEKKAFSETPASACV